MFWVIRNWGVPVMLYAQLDLSFIKQGYGKVLDAIKYKSKFVQDDIRRCVSRVDFRLANPKSILPYVYLSAFTQA